MHTYVTRLYVTWPKDTLCHVRETLCHVHETLCHAIESTTKPKASRDHRYGVLKVEYSLCLGRLDDAQKRWRAPSARRRLSLSLFSKK